MMSTEKKGKFPRWIFAAISVGTLLASGIFIGILSVEGYTVLRLIQALGFGVVGLVMFWGAFNRE